MPPVPFACGFFESTRCDTVLLVAVVVPWHDGVVQVQCSKCTAAGKGVVGVVVCTLVLVYHCLCAIR